MIADPAQANQELLNSRAGDLRDHVLTDALVALVAKTHNALIAIGMRSDTLEEHALAVAKAIGKVNVDHRQTSCKTPHASASIRKGRERQRTRATQALPA